MRTRKAALTHHLFWLSGAILLVVALLAISWLVDGREAIPAAAQDGYPELAVLPPVPIPADNPVTPEKIELGRLLFFDPRMSADGSLSCNSCHPADTGWGVQTAISFGGPGTSHWHCSGET